ncbi:hypothetical protein [Bacillus sp. FJAT-29937]|uniref:hypothetical protein n=1 Tax=Bacillus sp. FJAT-29937 TaxID=1720553 RepID=UPI000830B5C6|nr:hypothetical protein [Bacillus sp. FJAT-29937]
MTANLLQIAEKLIMLLNLSFKKLNAFLDKWQQLIEQNIESETGINSNFLLIYIKERMKSMLIRDY